MIKDVNNKGDKRISKWLLVTIIFAIIIALGGTIFFISQSTAVQERIAQKKQNKMHFEWPDTKMSSLLPVPPSDNGWIGHNSERALSVDIYNTSKEDLYEYINACRFKTHGFNLYEVSGSNSWKAYDRAGNILEISYYENEKIMHIHVYEPDEVRILDGINHYELEYYSCYAGESMKGVKNYDKVLDKYLSPVRTTIGDLKKDFPFEETSPGHKKSVPDQNINLDNNTEIWAYATYLDNYNCDVVKLTYDDLKISKDTLEIKTHFETVEELGSSTKKFRLIVLSIIPVNQ